MIAVGSGVGVLGAHPDVRTPFISFSCRLETLFEYHWHSIMPNVKAVNRPIQELECLIAAPLGLDVLAAA